ncbi:MAG: chemotaxis protein CheW [Moraxellaceae bacterium]|jgi:chemosensory pili system protein ChpC|nr:chemotaxis protein CheW [Moraxellaceae bacterium]
MATTQLTLNQTTLLGATTGTIACLITPVTGKQLLLPNVTVAEVVSANDRQPPPENAPEWHQGFVMWREMRIPVVAFEGLNDNAAPREYERIAILSGISAQRDLPYYGIAVQGIPRLAKVKIAELEDLEGAPTGPMEFLKVRYAGELTVIPDLDALEARLLA